MTAYPVTTELVAPHKTHMPLCKDQPSVHPAISLPSFLPSSLCPGTCNPPSPPPFYEAPNITSRSSPIHEEWRWRQDNPKTTYLPTYL